MQEQCTVRHAHTPTPEAANAILDRIEQEIARLKRHRPQLQDRITKAGNILVAHLAGRPAMPIVRVRISAAGKATFLFNSLTGNGAVYIVDPATWACTCPDYHRRGAACKHSLSAWVLMRVAQPAGYQVGRAS